MEGSEKAQNGDVRSFGKQMFADHTKTSDQLKKLVADKDIKVELPAKLDAEHQTSLDKLNGLSGDQFDKEFVGLQIDAHQKAIALFEGYAAAGENSDLKVWAKDTLPTLKEHLDHAQKLKTSVDQTAQADGTAKSDKLAAKSDATKKSDDATARDEKNSVANGDAKKPLPKGNIKYITRQTPTDGTHAALIA